MRTEEKKGVTLKYPNEVDFAFNDCLLIVEGKDLEQIEVQIKRKESEVYNVNFVLDAFKDRCYIDIKDYIQSYFDSLTFKNVNYDGVERSDMGIALQFIVGAKVFVEAEENLQPTNSFDIVEFQFDAFFVWGALNKAKGEEFNTFRTLTYFKGYPFTFDVCTEGEATIEIDTGGRQKDLIPISEQGIWDIPITEDMEAKSLYIVREHSQGAFTERLHIKVADDCYKGYYLRWVDRHGFYCYYLFKGGEEQIKTAGETITRNNKDLGYNDSFSGRFQLKTMESVVPICAPLVDSQTWEMLRDITTSPIVDLLVGYEHDNKPQWVSVNVVAGSYVKTHATLQDFICSIVLPEVNIQKL